MMIYWVEIIDAAGEVLLRSGYYTSRKHAEAKRTRMQEDPILQSHPTARGVIRFELSELIDSEEDSSK
jgi:hypothetical protein